MTVAKAEIIALPQPFSFPNPNPRITFTQAGAKTQNSVFVQREIEQFTTELTTGKNLTNPGNMMMTHRVHDQRNTNLCTSFSTVSVVRGSAINYMRTKGANHTKFRNDLERNNEFSFNTMLTLFTGNVSPRSLDGLIKNSRKNPHFMEAQIQTTNAAMDRLVNKTEYENFGWTRLGLSDLFQKYNVDPRNLDLEKIPVYHPKYAQGRKTFQDALGEKILIVVPIFADTLSSTANNTGHAATMFDFDQNTGVFKIKNSYFSEKMISIDGRLPLYREFIHWTRTNPTKYRQEALKIDPNFSDDNWILADSGFCLRFMDKRELNFF